MNTNTHLTIQLLEGSIVVNLARRNWGGHWLAASLALLLLTSALHAQAEISAQLSRLKSAPPDEYGALIDEILMAQPDLDVVASAIRRGVVLGPPSQRRKKLVGGWTAWSATDHRGVTRPYQLFVPPEMTRGSGPSALIVYLHGAVSRAEFGTGLGSAMAVGYAGLLFPSMANRENLAIVAPQGRGECAWWTDNGVAHIRAVIRDVRRRIDVPDRAIFGAGFSDGASGCYYLAMAAPDPFAGFLAMNGHPISAGTASGKQTYLRNMAITPMIAAMTGRDSLFPTDSVMPHLEAAIAAGAKITTVAHANMNHQPEYFQQESPRIAEFFRTTRRDDDLRELRWLASDPAIGTARWLQILEISETATESDAAPLPDLNPHTTIDRVRLGITRVSRASRKVAEVHDGSAAAQAGIQSDDVVVEFDGVPIGNGSAIARIVRKKSPGDKFSCKVKRGEQQLDLVGQFPASTVLAYRRDQPTALADCKLLYGQPSDGGDQAHIVLATRHVKRLRIWLPQDLEQFDRLNLSVNGSSTTLPVQAITSRDLLENFAATADGASARFAFVDVLP